MRRKITKIIVWVAVIGIFCLNLAVDAGAFGNYPQKSAERKDRMHNFIKELGLSQKQQAEIKEVRSQCREKSKELWGQIKEKKQALKKELEQPSVDKGRVNKLVAEITDLKGRQLQQRVDGILSMKEIFTPEQYEKFIQKKEAMRNKWKASRKGFCGRSSKCGLKGGGEDEK